MDELLLELEKAGLEVIDVKTQKEKERLAQRIINIKSKMRDWFDLYEKPSPFDAWSAALGKRG